MSRVLTAEGISAAFLRLLEGERLASMTVLDVGTGRGRLALALAPHCRRVVGIDIDATAINEARRRAVAGDLGTVEFLVADAEQVDFVRLAPGSVTMRPDMVVAHLYLSKALVEKSSTALGSGGVLGFVGFHADQWRETGRRSRFAWDEDAIRDLLEECDFRIDHLEVDTEVTTFGSVEEALAAVVTFEDRWRQDGRWFRYVEYLERGGRQLTRSHLIVKARRR
ncbi:MAG: methyltransferase domain-containing protein [Candidatus Rokuibacteriota bacterium]